MSAVGVPIELIAALADGKLRCFSGRLKALDDAVSGYRAQRLGLGAYAEALAKESARLPPAACSAIS